MRHRRACGGRVYVATVMTTISADGNLKGKSWIFIIALIIDRFFINRPGFLNMFPGGLFPRGAVDRSALEPVNLKCLTPGPRTNPSIPRAGSD